MSSYGEKTYGRKSKVVDEAHAVNKPKQSDVIGNTIIFTLVGLCILLFLFISIGFFFIVKPPHASLTSVALRNLAYSDTTSSRSSSSSPYFNATLAMEIRVENPNFGFFEFPTSKGDVFYNGRLVGEMKISEQRVASYSGIRREVKAEVSYRDNQGSSSALRNDIKRGLIILQIGAKLRGLVQLEVLNKRSVDLKCLMYINLRDEVIQRFWCK
ncbi:unnamed protein product [Microthlaspi erraticum]|uniref:Uncharacterized protein n=1 Tax=Microthlaspi erraticum TaxID=1685480 RepID=A0A6D2KBU3_9BRAS|nr:unnamed protein product [Microthlaspi erraticum]